MNYKKEIDDKMFQYLYVLYRELKHRLEGELKKQGIYDFLSSNNSWIAVSEIINKEMKNHQKENPDFNCNSGADFFKNLSSLKDKKKPAKRPHNKNLETLVIFLGYRNWEVFKSEVDTRLQIDSKIQNGITYIEPQTSLFDPDDINVEKLQPKEVITIGWYNEHYIRAIYKGAYKFEIIDVSDTINKKEGDTFFAKRFGIYYPWHCKTIKDEKGNEKTVSGFLRFPYIEIYAPTPDEIENAKQQKYEA